MHQETYTDLSRQVQEREGFGGGKLSFVSLFLEGGLHVSRVRLNMLGLPRRNLKCLQDDLDLRFKPIA